MKFSKTFLLFSSLFLWVNTVSKAQSSFYDVDSIQSVYLYFYQADWDVLLDSLYVAGQEERILANVRIDGILYDSVGVRYKGFSSVSVNRKKNPFNIKLDYRKKHRHKGIDKIKLSNVIQDPSFLREVMSYEIGRDYMPSPEANYAKLYINDEYWGLYTNVEAINKDFIAKHFYEKSNAFFKCNPQSLNLFGENANLGTSPGGQVSDYYPYYDLKSDNGWEALYHLIDTLNNHSQAIESVLNVDRTLWMHAFNYCLINFDSYVGYAQNYYLYQDHHGRFNPILWDLNMSFASYRLADASIHFSGFSIQQAKEMDPLLHYNSVSVYPRPLLRKLFEDTRYRKMYIAHMRSIMKEHFNNQDYASRLSYWHNLIDVAVQTDTNKFYTYTDFQDNIDWTVSSLIDYPGITDLMNSRAVYLNTYPGFQGAPTIDTSFVLNSSFQNGDTLTIRATVLDADTVFLAYRMAENELFVKVKMMDDGAHSDSLASDNIYGYQISNVSNQVQYYVYAENDTAAMFSPEKAAYRYHEATTLIQEGSLVINELMAINESSIQDENGDFDDWIELHNPNNYPVSTAGLYLSDAQNQVFKFALPSVSIPAGGYTAFWADQDTLDGVMHANFKLSGVGETVVLSRADGLPIDSVYYPAQINEIAYARYPNAVGPFQYRTPTFRANNDYTAVSSLSNDSELLVYPNPASVQLQLLLPTTFEQGQLEIIDINGRVLIQKDCYSNNPSIDLRTLSSGFYIVIVKNKQQVYSSKFNIH